MHREQDDLPDILSTTQEHAKSINAAAPACRRRHSVLESLDKLLVVSVQFFIALIFIVRLELGLRCEGFALLDCIVLFRVRIDDLHSVHKHFKSLSHELCSA